MMPMVVGREAAHTPSRLRVRSSIPDATTSGGTHSKHAVSPGMRSCMWPVVAHSDKIRILEISHKHCLNTNN